jgi:hypothetical protein
MSNSLCVKNITQRVEITLFRVEIILCVLKSHFAFRNYTRAYEHHNMRVIKTLHHRKQHLQKPSWGGGDNYRACSSHKLWSTTCLIVYLRCANTRMHEEYSYRGIGKWNVKKLRSKSNRLDAEPDGED